jgi:hypothetical protein
MLILQEPGSFRQTIHYRAEMAVMEELVNRSQDCSQHLTYDCRGARLLDQGEMMVVMEMLMNAPGTSPTTA